MPRLINGRLSTAKSVSKILQTVQDKSVIVLKQILLVQKAVKRSKKINKYTSIIM